MAPERPYPHDLLWFSTPDALLWEDPTPDWVHAVCTPKHPVVVRRDLPDSQGRIPVGIRGATRSQRLAAYLEADHICQRLTPETIAQRRLWEHWSGLPSPSAIQTLARLAPVLDDLGYPWGPTGGIGYTLATGLIVTQPHSDLDLVIRITQPPRPDQTQHLHAMFDRANCRLDVQIDTGRGGFALKEWLERPQTLLLKTDTGPVTVLCPWHPPPP